MGWGSLLGTAAGAYFGGPVGAAIGGSIGSALDGSDAASSAADAQVAASNAAIGEQRRQFDINQKNQKPFLDTGTAANQRLRQLLGVDSSYTGSDSGSLLKRFSSSDLENDPVYQNGLKFGLDQGTGAINARGIATGSYDSGATLKALTRYATDYGTTKANESYNRFNTDNTNIYNRLAGVSGAGQTAANAVDASGTNMANNVSGLMTGIGNANAAGIVGGANAWGGAVNGVTGAINNYQNSELLKQLLSRNGGGGGGGTSYDPSLLAG